MMKWIYFFIFSLTNVYSFGQSNNPSKLIHPKFGTFKGIVYSIPYNMIKKGYGKHVYSYEEIGTIEWEEINISNRHIDSEFPDVEKKVKFGIVLKSTMTIAQNSCYEFSLNSDDGSKLWINNRLVIDNDGDHRMRKKRASYRLEPGVYAIKIWYFQAYPDSYGFIFDSKNVGSACIKRNFIAKKDTSIKEEEIIVKTIPTPIKINFESNIFFNSAEYEIKEEVIPQLDSICTIIKKHNPKKIIITGHTDNRGTEKYNLTLSQKRANTLQHYLMGKINQVGIQYVAIGKGETYPIADNNTEEGRKENRRVEIILE